MEIQTITSLLDQIPVIISTVRNFLITTLANFGVSEAIFSIIIFALSLVGAWYFVKQWAASSMMFKISTIINVLVLALLFYMLFIYL